MRRPGGSVKMQWRGRSDAAGKAEEIVFGSWMLDVEASLPRPEPFEKRRLILRLAMKSDKKLSQWQRGCGSVVECGLPKPEIRVRFPSPAPLHSPSAFVRALRWCVVAVLRAIASILSRPQL